MLLLTVALLLADTPKPKLPVGPDTTIIEGPIDADGWVNFEAAVNDRLAKGVTPEANACALLWQVFGPTPDGSKPMHPDYFQRLGIQPPPADGAYFVPFERFLKQQGKETDDTTYTVERKLLRQPWTAKDHPDYAAWLTANEKPLAVAVEATRRSGYYNPLIARNQDGSRGLLLGALVPNVQACRGIGVALTQRAMRRTAEGKFEEAWADLLAVRRLARHVARGGTLIELLVGYSLDARSFEATPAFLAVRRPPAEQAAEQAAGYLRDLDALPPMPAPVEKFDLAERFVFLDCAQFVRRGGTDALEGLAGGQGKKVPADTAEKLMATLHWGTILRQANRWYDRGRDAARQPTRAARKVAWAKVEADLKEMKEELVATKVGEVQAAIEGGGDPEPKVLASISESIGGMLVGLLMPAVGKIHEAADRTAEQTRLTRLAVALAAHRTDAGKYPDTLAALAPKYLKAIEPDVFSGRPPVYRVSGNGYILYSVGMNEKDDEGRGTEDEPKGDDLVVRVP